MIKGYRELAKLLGVSNVHATTIAKVRGLPGKARTIDKIRYMTWDEKDVDSWKAQNPDFKVTVANPKGSGNCDKFKCTIDGCEKMVLHSSGKCMKHRTKICKCGNRFNMRNYVDSICGACKIRVKARDDYSWGR
jgi:hypothetical protein